MHITSMADYSKLMTRMEKEAPGLTLKKKFLVIFDYLMKSEDTADGFVDNKMVASVFQEVFPNLCKERDWKQKGLDEKSYIQSLKEAKKLIRKFAKGKLIEKRSAIAYIDKNNRVVDNILQSFKSDQIKKLKEIVGLSKDILPPAFFDYIYGSATDDKHIHKVLDFGSNLDLAGLELLPDLYDAIIRKQVIIVNFNFDYKDIISLMIAPIHLKKYNERWYVAGLLLADTSSDVIRYDAWALDRIIDFKIVEGITCAEQSSDCYDTFFDDVIGIRRPAGVAEETLTIRTYRYKVHQLLATKKLHPSQHEEPFDWDKNQGIITLKVIPNIELQTKLLSFGADIKLLGDGDFQKKFRQVVLKMAELYNNR